MTSKQEIDDLADRTIDLKLATNETSGNLEFLNDEEAQVSSLRINGNLRMPVGFHNSYEEYFQRPAVLGRGVIAVSDTTAYRNIMEWPSAVANIYSSKLQGVYAFNADISVRLVVNANKMQAGRLRLSAVPINELSTVPAVWYQRYLESKSTISTLPNVEIDLACTSEAVLKLPWCFARHATNSAGSLWAICVEVYTPLRVGTGSNTISWTAYVIHDKFRTFGSSGRVIFQSGVASEKKQAGIVSHTLSKFVRTFNALQPIPFIGSYMNGASGITQSLVNAANVWGLSAPSIRSPENKMVAIGTGNMATAVKMESVRFMGIDANTSLPVTKVTGSDVDEMSISHIISKPSYFTSFTWTTAQAQDSPLFGKSYRMVDFFSVVGAGKWGVTPLSYMAQLFRFWRGTVKLRVKFSRTPFHTGRMMVVVFPRTTTDLSRNITAYRKIIDISETSEVDIDIPYVQIDPFRRTSEEAFLIEMYVVDQLTAPSTVSSTIDIVLEIAGGDDFVFAAYYGRERNLQFSGFSARPVSSFLPMSPLTNGQTSFTPQSGCIEKSSSFEKEAYDPLMETNCFATAVRSIRPLLKIEQGVGLMNGTFSNNVLDPWGLALTNNSFMRALPAMYFGFRGSMRVRFTEIVGAADVAGFDVSYILGLGDLPAANAGDGAIFSVASSLRGRQQRLISSNLPERSAMVEIPYEFKLPFINTWNGFLSEYVGYLRLANATSSDSTEVFTSAGDDFDCQFFLGVPTVGGPLPP